MSSTIADQLREERPGMAEKAKKSRKYAIRLFCLECMGGLRAEVRRCEVKGCFLHPFRMGTAIKDQGNGQ